MTDGKEESTNDARCEGTVWESSRWVGGDHGEGDGVAAIGVVKLHVARKWGLSRLETRLVTRRVSATFAMADRTCCVWGLREAGAWGASEKRTF